MLIRKHCVYLWKYKEMKKIDSITPTKQVKQSKGQEFLLQGGRFSRARYSMTALGEDVKNCIIELLQLSFKAQTLLGPMSLASIKNPCVIPTDYGGVEVVRIDDTKDKDLKSIFFFTAPYQFFIRGRRTDTRIYHEIEDAFMRLSTCEFEVADSQEKFVRNTYTGLVGDVSFMSAKSREQGLNSYISFSITSEIIDMLFDCTRGFYKFLNGECASLTSAYAKRMYVLFSSQRAGFILKFYETTFRSMFALEDKYKKFYDMERVVIDPLIKDINKSTSLTVDYKVSKGTFKQKVICFNILKNEIFSVRKREG